MEGSSRIYSGPLEGIAAAAVCCSWVTRRIPGNEALGVVVTSEKGATLREAVECHLVGESSACLSVELPPVLTAATPAEVSSAVGRFSGLVLQGSTIEQKWDEPIESGQAAVRFSLVVRMSTDPLSGDLAASVLRTLAEDASLTRRYLDGAFDGARFDSSDAGLLRPEFTIQLSASRDVLAADEDAEVPASLLESIGGQLPEVQPSASRPAIAPSSVAQSRSEGIPTRKERAEAKRAELEEIRAARAKWTRPELEAKLRESVKGQDAAISVIARRAVMNFKGLVDSDRERPLMVVLAAGSSGVGKTALAKALADVLFDGRLIREDMAEHASATNTRLVGAPPGYVGFRESDDLTARLARVGDKGAVLIFDEWEKSSEVARQTLLSAFDDGASLTNGRGRKVSLAPFLIIITTNLGSAIKPGQGFGFGVNDPEVQREKYEQDVMSTIRAGFSPELFGRLDDCVVFAPLPDEVLVEIATARSSRMIEQLEAVGFRIELDEASIRNLALSAKDEALGARPILRALERVREALADYQPGRFVIRVDEDGEVTVQQQNS